MARDWSSSALDKLIVEPRLARTAQPLAAGHGVTAPVGAVSVRLRLGWLLLPAMCLLTGIMATLLYVWPLLLIVHMVSGGFRPAIFWATLLASTGIASVACFAITVAERRYWADNWTKLNEFADPPTWK